MITKEYVEEYLHKVNLLIDKYNKDTTEIYDEYSSFINKELPIKVGDVINIDNKEEIIVKIEIKSNSILILHTANKNKGNGRWSKKSHYGKMIQPYKVYDIEVLRHEEYNID